MEQEILQLSGVPVFRSTCFPEPLFSAPGFRLSNHFYCLVFVDVDYCLFLSFIYLFMLHICPCRRDRERMVVGFISTYVISAYHH